MPELVITSVVQSSSVTVSILVVMGSYELIGLDICMLGILGCNIGSCTTALLREVLPRQRRVRLFDDQ